MTHSPTFPTSLDSTMLSAYTDCPQKFFLEYCLKLAPSGVSPDLHAGGALAAGFEAARKGFYFENLSQEEATFAGLAAFTKYWGWYEPPEKHVKTYLNCAFALSEYFNKYPMKTDHARPIRLPDNRPAVEYTFALPTDVPHPETGEPILFSGRCDLVASLRDNGGAIAVVDEKTTKSISNTFFRKWSMRGQFYGYAKALQMTGLDVEYALIRGIGLQVSEIVFAEVLQPLTDFNIDKWWVATNQKIAEIAGRWKYMNARRIDVAKELRLPASDPKLIEYQNKVSHTPWTYAFGEACEGFSGCAFKKNCLSKNPHLYYDDYDRRTWDPLAKNPTEGNIDTLSQIESTELPEGVFESFKAGTL